MISNLSAAGARPRRAARRCRTHHPGYWRRLRGDGRCSGAGRRFPPDPRYCGRPASMKPSAATGFVTGAEGAQARDITHGKDMLTEAVSCVRRPGSALSTACATPSSAGRWADRRHGFDHRTQRLNGHLRGPRKTRGRSTQRRVSGRSSVLQRDKGQLSTLDPRPARRAGERHAAAAQHQRR